MVPQLSTIKKIEDLGNVKMIESDTMHAMAMLFVPLELARRDIEKHYYNVASNDWFLLRESAIYVIIYI